MLSKLLTGSKCLTVDEPTSPRVISCPCARCSGSRQMSYFFRHCSLFNGIIGKGWTILFDWTRQKLREAIRQRKMRDLKSVLNCSRYSPRSLPFKNGHFVDFVRKSFAFVFMRMPRWVLIGEARRKCCLLAAIHQFISTALHPPGAATLLQRSPVFRLALIESASRLSMTGHWFDPWDIFFWSKRCFNSLIFFAEEAHLLGIRPDNFPMWHVGCTGRHSIACL